ncbi:sialate O-acetylesterase [Sphingosinicella terrae]|uniref:sialate O-acetylesterase n=1 Tax=Sphingosinicella terrae TaxID=2172047 RepID=UPI002547D117|nr:sialate O-acetylesterase [Sphingosinicella terrae]
MRLFIPLLVAVIPGPALAEVRLDPLFSDHAVLQRGRPIPVWGTADPGERITVSLGETRQSVTADGAGAWRAVLPAMMAGGPHRLAAVSAAGRAEAADILIGDVWLCSGQSNMEMTVSQSLNGYNESQSANDGQLRLLTVPHLTGNAAQASFPAIAWQAAGRDSVGGFSAACYYMVKDLRRSERVPIGAIASSWGGTPIRAWMDDAGVAATLPDDYRQLELFRRDPATANRAFGEQWSAWWRRVSGDPAGGEPWNASDRLGWSPVPQLRIWEEWGDPRFAEFDGMMWMRKRFTLSAAEATSGATLSLGVIDEHDETFVNGVPVGGTYSWETRRDYAVAPGQLRSGENEILVNVLDSWGGGGMAGPAERIRLTLADGSVKPLGDGWEYSVVTPTPETPPSAPWSAPMGLTAIYNGMIAPLRDYGLAGIAWYQGEADVERPGSYADRLAAMMAGWRRQFGRDDLPFLIVSLANYGEPATAPAASGWAALREQQRLAAVRDPRAGLVVAMDLGERDDIHPANKSELGRRLARAARHLAYGADRAAGPEIVRARRAGDGIVLDFAGAVGSLQTWSGTRALAFELCGDSQESCRYAEATASGATVRLADDGYPVTRVRYAWGEAPVTNLYDEDEVPVGPFEVTVE